MLEQHGTVVEQRGAWARVRVQRDQHCSQCATTGGCGAVTLAAALPRTRTECWVPSRDTLQAGQSVTVTVAEGDAVAAAALVYLVPLLGLLIAAACSHPLGEPASVMGGALGLATGLFGARRLATRLLARGHWQLGLVDHHLPPNGAGTTTPNN